MKIIPLGTNGFFSTYGRQTACYAIPLDKTLIILDAGSGLFRLAEPIGQELLKDAKEIHLYLSHYHLDHTFGFYAAFKLLKGKKVTVFACGGRQVFSEFIELEYFPINYSEKHKNFRWKVIDEGIYDLISYKVSVRKQNHRGEVSLGFRFKFSDGELAYITDTEPTKKSIEFVRNVDLLLHEHGYLGKELIGKKLEEQTIDGHVTTLGAATIAKEAKVGSLALIHHFPFYDYKRFEVQLNVARTIFPKTYLAQDLKEIEF